MKEIQDIHKLWRRQRLPHCQSLAYCRQSIPDITIESSNKQIYYKVLQELLKEKEQLENVTGNSKAWEQLLQEDDRIALFLLKLDKQMEIELETFDLIAIIIERLIKTVDFPRKKPILKMIAEGQLRLQTNLKTKGDYPLTPAQLLRPPQQTPFHFPLTGGLHPGKIIYISGTPTPDAVRFSVNFKSGFPDESDIGFHFEVRFNWRSQTKILARNSKISLKWQTEETLTPTFPFKQNVPFDMAILVEYERFQVAVNNEHTIAFVHRFRPLSRMKCVEVCHNVIIEGFKCSDVTKEAKDKT